MKKTTIFYILLILVLCFVGCDDTPSGENRYDTLNELVNKEYGVVVIEIVTELDGDTLRGTYTAKQDGEFLVVEYSYEKYNTYEFIDGVIVPPSEVKSTLEGSIKTKDGKVVEESGDPSNVSIQTLNFSGIEFKEEYFANIKMDENSFEADVIFTRDFLNSDTIFKDMKVKVNHTKDSLTDLTITYKTTKGTSVTLRYTFEK